jgi:hypothetical protein
MTWRRYAHSHLITYKFDTLRREYVFTPGVTRYYSAAHLDSHVTWILEQVRIDAQRPLMVSEETTLYYIYRDICISENWLPWPDLYQIIRVSTAHAFFCGLFDPSRRCDCKPGTSLASDRAAVGSCAHESAPSGPLFHSGDLWTFCRKCGAWLEIFNPNKKEA